MKPNPEQDADRAAFEKWADEQGWDRNTPHRRQMFVAWKAAKADERARNQALQADNERLGEALHKSDLEHQGYAITIAQREYEIDCLKRMVRVMEKNENFDFEAALAAPFRKTGV